MAITEPYELDGVSISGSEISIVSGTTSLQTKTDKGVYGLYLDPVGAALAKGDEFVVRIYEKVELTGGTKRLAFKQYITDAQSQICAFHELMLFNGWDMTIQKIAGTDRNWDASIRAVTGSGLTEPYELDGVTVGGSELSLVTGTTSLATDTSDGKFQFWVDASAMARDDIFEFRIYEKVEGTGGTKRLIFEARLEDAQIELFYTPILTLINGWDATLKKISGTDRAFDASVRQAA